MIETLLSMIKISVRELDLDRLFVKALAVSNSASATTAAIDVQLGVDVKQTWLPAQAPVKRRAVGLKLIELTLLLAFLEAYGSLLPLVVGDL